MPLTVQKIFDRYLKEHSLPRGNERIDRSVMRAPLLAFGNRFHPTPRGIEEYTKARAAGKHGIKPAAPATIRRELTALQAVLNWGSRNGMIKGEPVFRFTKPVGANPRTLWVTENDQEIILGKLPDAPLGVQIFVKLGLTYGVRLGAIMDLRFNPDQIDFEARSIDFYNPQRRATRKRRPVVPMTASIEQLLAWRRLKLGGGATGAPVCEFTTHPYKYQKFMQSIGYGWVSAHVLKHSAITLMLRAGVSPLDVARVTATDLTTIYKTYRHHTVDELRTIVEGRGV